jgi:ribonucleoside-diphosphate reductase alpha chain
MLNDIGQVIWNSKYRAYEGETFEEGCERVVSITDGYFTPDEQQRLFDYIYNQKFSPGGRVWYAAGKPKPQYANCALLGVDDNAESWGTELNHAMLSLTKGMGIGFSMDKVRGKGERIYGLGGYASGTLSYVSMVNEIARHIIQGSSRRSACLASIHWKHKDVYDWVTAKNWNEDYTRMKSISVDYPAPFDIHNLSIRYDPEFLEAYHNEQHKDHKHAKAVFDQHMYTQFSTGDPNIMYTKDDQIYTNACSEVISNEQNEVCILGSINLANITDTKELAEVTALAAKFMLVTKWVNLYPYEAMAEVGTRTMRIGLGIMGMHNWLLERGYPYEWNNELEEWFKVYNYSGWQGAHSAVRDYGFNVPVALFAQAPTGSISRLFGGISGGIEPIFAAAYLWRYQDGNERKEQITIDPYVLQLVQSGKINPYEPFTDALSLATPEGFKHRVDMQANIQRYTDNAISSTINLPQWGTPGNDTSTLEYYKKVILEYMPYLRGLTIYAEGARSGQPLTKVSLIDALEDKGYEIDSSYSNCSSGLCST